jgi:clan AA aspartic protease
MGSFRVPVEVGDPAGARFVSIHTLVDTGAAYTRIPRDILDRLGVAPEEDWPFVLADRREVQYPVALTQIKLGSRARPTIVVFGDPGTEPLLGAFTLEGFRLAADPVNRRLISVPGLLKATLIGSGERTAGSGKLDHPSHQSKQCPQHPVQQRQHFIRFFGREIVEFGTDSHQAFRLRRGPKRDPQMAPEVQLGAQGVPLDDIGFDGDHGPFELVEQRARPRVVPSVGAAQDEND